MNVIAERGGTYLVDIDGEHAYVVDKAGKVHGPGLLQGILARGYWREFDGDPEPILALVGGVTPGGDTGGGPQLEGRL